MSSGNTALDVVETSTIIDSAHIKKKHCLIRGLNFKLKENNKKKNVAKQKNRITKEAHANVLIKNIFFLS